MSKKKNDIFEYEKQWGLYKGNEYMYHLLSKMRPKISCKCPQSYIDFQKMHKNNMLGLAKDHEVKLQNKRLKKKLNIIHLSKSTVNNYVESYPKIQQMKSHLIKSQKTLSKSVEESKIRWENANMYKRITDSKSFFSSMKGYSNFNNKSRSRRRIINDARSSSNKTIHANSQITDSYNTPNISAIEESKNYGYFDYCELNKEILKKNNYSISLYKKTIYIINFGLVNVKANYQLNKLTIVIEPFASSPANIYLIIITEDYSLATFPILFKSFDEMVFSIKYIKDTFTFKKLLPGFNFFVDIASKEKKQSLLQPNSKSNSHRDVKEIINS